MQNESEFRCSADGQGDIDLCLCPIEDVMNVISKKWALLVIAALGNGGKLRFNEIKKKLGGVSPKSLSDRLKELRDAGLVNREILPETPPRVEYSLTGDGLELRQALVPLLRWISGRAGTVSRSTRPTI